MKPLVSVLIQAYNHKNYMADAVESVFKQEGCDYEVWLHDDGSTDGSEELLVDLQRRWPALKVTRGENRGLISVLNEMFERSTGEYILYLAADDRLLEGHLQTFSTYLNENPDTPAVTGGVRVIDSLGKPLSSISQVFRGDSNRRVGFNDIFMGRIGLSAVPMLFRRSALSDIFPIDRSVDIEDFHILLRLTEAGATIALRAGYWAEYRLHASNMHHKKKRMMEGLLQEIEVYRYHTNYRAAKIRWRGAFLSEMALSLKLEAVRGLVEDLRRGEVGVEHLKALLKLPFPASLWQFFKRV